MASFTKHPTNTFTSLQTAHLLAGGDDVIELKPMSTIGTKRTFGWHNSMSAIGGKADIAQTCALVPVSECMRRLAKQLELSG